MLGFCFVLFVVVVFLFVCCCCFGGVFGGGLGRSILIGLIFQNSKHSPNTHLSVIAP